MEKKAKLEIFKFLRISALSQGFLRSNYALSEILQKYAY